MTPRIIVDATAEPVTFDDIIDHSMLSYDQQQTRKTLIESYIRTARASCENYINGTISQKTLEIALEWFPCWWSTNGHDQRWAHIYLPLGPVQTIVSVEYVDTAGVDQVLDPATYVLDKYSRPQALRLAYGASWPSVRTQFDAVKIRYTAGYPFNDSPPVPAPDEILHAIRLQVDHMIENKTAVDVNTLAELPLGIKYLLDPYRLEMGV